MLIMTFATKSIPAFTGNVTRAAIRTVSGTKALIRAWINRRTVMSLDELDDRELKDIGLVRSDVAGALATSWLRDPSAVLVERSSQIQSAAASRRGDGLRRAVVSDAPVRQPARQPASQATKQPREQLEIACNA